MAVALVIFAHWNPSNVCMPLYYLVERSHLVPLFNPLASLKATTCLMPHPMF
jgi:hypothetical protein